MQEALEALLHCVDNEAAKPTKPEVIDSGGVARSSAQLTRYRVPTTAVSRKSAAKRQCKMPDSCCSRFRRLPHLPPSFAMQQMVGTQAQEHAARNCLMAAITVARGPHFALFR